MPYYPPRRPTPVEPGLQVNYQDVLNQAVLNERWRVLRELTREVEALRIDESYYNGTKASSVKTSVLNAIKRLEPTT